MSHESQEAEYLKTQEKNIRKIAQQRISEILDIQPRPHFKQVLDLGSNWGFYLDEYRNVGWRAFGVEPCKEYPDYPGRINARLQDLPIKTQEYNVITAFCIFEHLNYQEFREAVEWCALALKPNGLLVIKSPWSKGWTGRFAPNKYYLDTTHKIELAEIDLMEIMEENRMVWAETIIEGIHPERVFRKNWKWLKRLTSILGMGDARVWYFRRGY